MSNASLARLLGLSEQETNDSVNAIVASGVATREQNGALICRRMVREQTRVDNLRVNASKGGSKTSSKRQANPQEDEDEDEERVRARVREFARGEGIGERDSDWFFYKCQANGWTNAGKPIRDWKSTIRSWWRGGFFPSQRRLTAGARSDGLKPLDKSKIDVPERFKVWVGEHYPDKREEAMKWRTWSDVPQNGLREEWWREAKKGFGL